MADRIEHYRGYEIAYSQRGRKVRLQIREKDGLPSIVEMPLEDSDAAAKSKARELIDAKLSEAS